MDTVRQDLVDISFIDIKEIFSLFHVKIQLKNKGKLNQERLLQKFFYAADFGLSHLKGMQLSFDDILKTFLCFKPPDISYNNQSFSMLLKKIFKLLQNLESIHSQLFHILDTKTNEMIQLSNKAKDSLKSSYPNLVEYMSNTTDAIIKESQHFIGQNKNWEFSNENFIGMHKNWEVSNENQLISEELNNHINNDELYFVNKFPDLCNLNQLTLTPKKNAEKPIINSITKSFSPLSTINLEEKKDSHEPKKKLEIILPSPSNIYPIDGQNDFKNNKFFTSTVKKDSRKSSENNFKKIKTEADEDSYEDELIKTLEFAAGGQKLGKECSFKKEENPYLNSDNKFISIQNNKENLELLLSSSAKKLEENYESNNFVQRYYFFFNLLGKPLRTTHQAPILTYSCRVICYQ